MSDVRGALLDMVLTDHGYDHAAQELWPLRLEAARAAFRRQREAIPILAKRAGEAGVDDIRSLEDIVPLLFSHTVYKSYPPVLIEKKRWDKMNVWLSTLSTDDFTGLDVTGIDDADDWIARLAESGTIVLATSGSSGKCSFLPYSASDRAMKLRQFRNSATWPDPALQNDWLVFWTAPIEGPSSVIEAGQFKRELFARPDGFHHYLKDPLKISEVSQMAAFARKMAEGTAAPAEIAMMEAKGREKAARAERDFAEFIDVLLKYRHQPLMLSGLWSQFMQIIDRARELGIPDGDWNQNSRITAGGGVKAAALPPDYKERSRRFFGDVRGGGVYSMTEITQQMPRCEKERYHIPPGLIALVVDGAGERVLNAESGVVEGRFAFLDLLIEGRWGGVISGDRVEMDFSERCLCGRPGPVILDTISRYKALGEEDHIGCAGTIDAYVKGAMAE